MKKQLKPLDDFKDKITDVTSHQLTIQLPEQKSDNEINVLIKAFNTMMKRLNEAFLAQKEFTTSASHEIKTPLTRMSFQLENLSNLTKEEKSKDYINSIQNEVFQLSDTVNSLLILSKVEEGHDVHFENVRMDEVIFDAFSKVKKNFKEFEMDFEIKEQSADGDLTIKGIKSLLEIVFINLLKMYVSILMNQKPR
jgi:signal transduction histidine kinase